MNKFRIFSALLDNSLYIELRLFDEVIDCVDTTKYAVFIFVLINTEIRLSRDKEPIFID
jgi:hypothetical protein